MFAARSGAKTLKLVTKKIRIIFFKKNQKKYDLFFRWVARSGTKTLQLVTISGPEVTAADLLVLAQVCAI
jgi:hypothetical protein